MSRLILLSGWACDARIWEPLAPYWPAGLEVAAPDWPGYAGRPPLASPASLDELASAMAPDLTSEDIWVGWSLGGLLAGALLDHLPAPRGLILLGIGDRFPHPQGVSSRQLDDFRKAFRRSPDTAREHFLRWQLGGEDEPRRAHRALSKLLGKKLPASLATLDAGLEQLAQLDNQQRLSSAPCPVYRLSGERDPLLCPELRHHADRHIDNAGHCPMLSQPRQLTTKLLELAGTPLSDTASPEPTP